MTAALKISPKVEDFVVQSVPCKFSETGLHRIYVAVGTKNDYKTAFHISSECPPELAQGMDLLGGKSCYTIVEALKSLWADKPTKASNLIQRRSPLEHLQSVLSESTRSKRNDRNRERRVNKSPHILKKMIGNVFELEGSCFKFFNVQWVTPKEKANNVATLNFKNSRMAAIRVRGVWYVYEGLFDQHFINNLGVEDRSALGSCGICFKDLERPSKHIGSAGHKKQTIHTIKLVLALTSTIGVKYYKQEGKEYFQPAKGKRLFSPKNIDKTLSRMDVYFVSSQVLKDIYENTTGEPW